MNSSKDVLLLFLVNEKFRTHFFYHIFAMDVGDSQARIRNNKTLAKAASIDK